MSLGDRLGFAGLIVGFLSIAAFYLWPDKKWIGWLCLGAAVLLILSWFIVELSVLVGFVKSNPRVTTVLALIIGAGILGVFAWQKWIKKPNAPIATLPTPIEPPISKNKTASQLPKASPKMAKTYLQLSSIVPNQQFSMIAAGQRLGMNVYTRNMGPAPAHEVFPYTRIQIAKPTTESQIRKTFLEEAMRNYNTAMRNGINKQLGIGEEAWDTLTVGPFEENEVTEFLQGSLRLYAFSWVKWKDPDGNLGTWTQCEWLQVPRSNQLKKEEMVWHFCDSTEKTKLPSTASRALAEYDYSKQRLLSDPDKLTLYDLYLTDFEPSEVKHGRTLVIKTEPEAIKMEATVVWQVETGTEFVMFYIPYNKGTDQLCLYLKGQYKRLLDESHKFNAEIKVPGESEQVSAKGLMFSNRMFIYHEAYLSPEQVIFVRNYYAADGVTVLLRSTDYLSNRKLDAKVKMLERNKGKQN